MSFIRVKLLLVRASAGNLGRMSKTVAMIIADNIIAIDVCSLSTLALKKPTNKAMERTMAMSA
jgi:hypothetical protein